VYGDGVAFELSQTGGLWTEKVLYTFNRDKGGGYPCGSMIFDHAGNLYGTLSLAGPLGGGVAFELSPTTSGEWKETTLHAFGGANDGSVLNAGLVFDAAGNLYGTTTSGGQHLYDGTVFQLSRREGVWTEKVIHSFNHDGKDGISPSCTLVVDAAGNVYGTTERGGANNGGGTVFELMPQSGGGWKEKIIIPFAFTSYGPHFPHAGLAMDSAGNLYGTTWAGGAHAEGTVFQLTPTAAGNWAAHVLYSFDPTISDGNEVVASLIMDSAGNLYGTANRGGIANAGTVFKVAPVGNGTWTETTLHSFAGGTDGSEPYDTLMMDAAGNLYGTTFAGGTMGDGVVFEITP
jgi:uncharacterized repeat protein (TIGR03803 family)